MLNPALLAVIIAGAAEQHQYVSGELMPWEYSFIAAPLVLHRDTRRELPKRIDSHFTKWIVENPVLVSGFGARAESLVPYVREGLRFGLRLGSLRLENDGTLEGAISKSAVLKKSPELAEIVQASGFVGRWFTTAERSASVFGLLGVAP